MPFCVCKFDSSSSCFFFFFAQGANEGGKNYGDEYLAELDYVEVVEGIKEGYESDVLETEVSVSPTDDPKKGNASDEEDTSKNNAKDNDDDDEDYMTNYIKRRNQRFKSSAESSSIRYSLSLKIGNLLHSFLEILFKKLLFF